MKLQLSLFAKSIIRGYITGCFKDGLLDWNMRQTLEGFLQKTEGLSCNEALAFIPYVSEKYQATSVPQVKVVTAFFAFANCIEE